MEAGVARIVTAGALLLSLERGTGVGADWEDVVTGLGGRSGVSEMGVTSLGLMFRLWSLCRVDIGDSGRHQTS